MEQKGLVKVTRHLEHPALDNWKAWKCTASNQRSICFPHVRETHSFNPTTGNLVFLENLVISPCFPTGKVLFSLYFKLRIQITLPGCFRINPVPLLTFSKAKDIICNTRVFWWNKSISSMYQQRNSRPHSSWNNKIQALFLEWARDLMWRFQDTALETVVIHFWLDFWCRFIYPWCTSCFQWRWMEHFLPML